MNVRYIAVLVFATACMAARAQDTAPKDTRPCVSNFTVDGSFFKGTAYKTWQEHDGVTYDTAFRKVAQAVAANGWGTVTSNKDTGIVSASQAVTMGKGSVAPLNVIVQEKSSKTVRIEVNFNTGPGQKASEDVARDGLCKLAEAPGK
jgi:hypothetical protein